MMKSRRRPTVLIVGLGNLLLADEGLGVHVVRALEARALPTGVELMDGGTGGPTVAQAIARADAALVVDAALMDAEPATMRVLDEAVLERLKPRRDLGPHAAGLADILAFLTLLRWQGSLRVLAVQPAEVRPALELSGRLQEALQQIAERALAEASRLVEQCAL